MLLVVGLGNPGRRYENHRHNVGFMAADEIHRRHRLSPWRARFEGEIAEGEIDGEKALVLKPMTFMNESGRSVGQAARFYKLKPADIVVVHDELDLPPGKLRMKTGGGNGGHKGLKSIDAHFGKDYRRIRIGIGHPGAKELVNGHVLHDFAKDDRDWLDPLLGAIADNAPLLVKSDDGNFMNQVHLATGEAKLPKAAREARTEHAGNVVAGAAEKAHRGGILADGLRKLFRRPE